MFSITLSKYRLLGTSPRSESILVRIFLGNEIPTDITSIIYAIITGLSILSDLTKRTLGKILNRCDESVRANPARIMQRLPKKKKGLQYDIEIDRAIF